MDNVLKNSRQTSERAENSYFEGDRVIWIVVFMLAAISILVVYSAAGSLAFRRMEGDTEYYLLKHASLVLLSLVAMWLCHKVDFRYYSRLSRFALLISVPILIATWFFGTTINEATRWITIPFINQSFQASDLAKLALIANVASMLSKRQQSIHEFQRAILPILFWCGLICGLIALSDLSGAALLFATCVLLMFIGRVPVRYLGMLFFIGITVAILALQIGQRKETAMRRFTNFISTDHKEIPFQTEQSYIAIASGELTGKGPGNSDQRNFLPYPYSDFIFAIIVEEYGLFGGFFVIMLYLTLLYRGMLAMAKSERAFGGLLSAGLSFSLVVQAFVHMGVTLGVVPVTGLPLPLLSMGGTSLFFTGIALGIILSVSRGEIEDLEPQTQADEEKIFRRG
ncbi:MAG: FtsW/RodA/SpoVE family cell cycle protein [Bernardetiaceae bacterium]|nr:FtsW/RodA/SpoVE family cell cycle protein [Bernardetiaceae bacterium]